MASIVVRGLPPVPPKRSIVITLTEEEAGSLRHLFYAGVALVVINKMGLDSLYSELQSIALVGGSCMEFSGTAQVG